MKKSILTLVASKLTLKATRIQGLRSSYQNSPSARGSANHHHEMPANQRSPGDDGQSRGALFHASPPPAEGTSQLVLSFPQKPRLVQSRQVRQEPFPLICYPM